MNTSARSRLRTTALLSACSGLPYALVTETMPLYLRHEHVGLVDIGKVLSLVQLPWSLKLVLGPLVDTYGTPMRWTRSCLSLLFGLQATLAWAAQSHWFALIYLLLGGITLASATQDVAIDGLFVHWWASSPDTSIANSVRTTSYRLAMVTGGAGTAVLSRTVGWTPALGAFGCLLGLLMLSTFLLPSIQATAETPAAKGLPTVAPWSHFSRTLADWLAQPGMATVLLFTFLFRLGDFAMAPMVRTFWLDQGIEAWEIGLVNTAFGIGLGILGGIGGGLYIGRFGVMRGLLYLGLIQALSNLGYALVASYDGGRRGLYLAAAVENLAQGLGSMALLVLLTRMCTPKQGATQFAALSALTGLSRLLAGYYSGAGAEWLGYGGYFGLTFLLSLPAFCLLPQVRRFNAGLDVRALALAGAA